MKETIIYDSLTGNTKELAETIKKERNNAYCEKISDKLTEEVRNANIFYIGTPIIKGMPTKKITSFLQQLENKKIFLFFTMGYGGSKDYYNTLKERIIKLIPKTNQIIGAFFCQGKMPESVKERYVELIKEHPEDKKLQVILQNFEKAKTHPNNQDKENLIKEINKINLT